MTFTAYIKLQSDRYLIVVGPTDTRDACARLVTVILEKHTDAKLVESVCIEEDPEKNR